MVTMVVFIRHPCIRPTLSSWKHQVSRPFPGERTHCPLLQTFPWWQHSNTVSKPSKPSEPNCGRFIHFILLFLSFSIHRPQFSFNCHSPLNRTNSLATGPTRHHPPLPPGHHPHPPRRYASPPAGVLWRYQKKSKKRKEMWKELAATTTKKQSKNYTSDEMADLILNDLKGKFQNRWRHSHVWQAWPQILRSKSASTGRCKRECLSGDAI